MPPSPENRLDKRVVRLFDFDAPGNPNPVPPGWERTTLTPDGHAREGFAKFNRAEIDDRIAHSGKRSVRLPTNGQSTALRLKPGEAAVFADADYAVTAQVRTDGLEHARAFLTVRLLDQHLHAIPGSEVRSEPVLSPGLWKAAGVQVPGGKADAAWLQIDLELLQPRQFTPPGGDEPAARALEKHRLYREDVQGSAWFDDVAVMQIPRAAITTTSPCNIVLGGEKPTLRVNVRDLGGASLRGRVRVLDVRGRVIDEYASIISPDGRPLEFTPRLPGFGWFRARLDVLNAGGDGLEAVAEGAPVSHAEVDFVHIPAVGGSGGSGAGPVAEGARGGGSDGAEGQEAAVRARAAAQAEADRARFGLIAEGTPDECLAQLPPLCARLGTRFVYLPAWEPGSLIAGSAGSLAVRRSSIDALVRQGQVVTFSLGGIPSELSRETLAPADDALSIGAMPSEKWLPYLSPTLDLFGQRVLHYQVGGLGDDHAFWKRSLAQDVEAVEGALATLVPGPIIGLPWSADRALPSLARAGASKREPGAALSAAPRAGPLVDALTLTYPVGFPASEMGPTLARFMGAPSAGGPPELTVTPELPEQSVFGASAVITELMRRSVELWRVLGDGSGAAPPLRLALAQPWRWGESVSASIRPKPEMAVLAVLAERLSGRRIVGELVSVAGVKCYILAARNTALGTLERGAMVAWDESAEARSGGGGGRAVVDAAAVGSAVSVVDAFGNVTSIPVPGIEAGASAAGAASPLVTVPVGEAPVFIEGIDPYLALFAASFRLEPSFMPAVVREHEHRITLSNPWPVRITGKLQLKEDAEAAPRARHVVTDEWRISPTGIIDFDMAPGQTQSLPVTISFGPGQLAGVKDFVIVARPVADRPYPPIRMHASVEVGLVDIEMNPELQIGGAGEVIVVVSVSNKGTRPRTIRLETAARNMPSQQLQVSDLPAGQTVLRRFVFKDGAAALSGRRIVISLSDLEEAERLNKAVLVP